jgi:ferredoxin
VSPARRGARPELRVNPIACEAHGMCIELLPELISSDPWGYPLLRPGPVPPELLGLARRAVNACPTMALLLTTREPPAGQRAGRAPDPGDRLGTLRRPPA